MFQCLARGILPTARLLCAIMPMASLCYAWAHDSQATTESQSQPRGRLLRDVPATVNVQPPADETILRSRAVQVRFEQLNAIDWTQAGAAMEMNFFDDASFIARFEKYTINGQNSYAWTGSLEEEEEGGWFVLVVHHGVVIANFWSADGRSYELRPAGDGQSVYFVHETLQEQFAPCATCAAHARGVETDSSATRASSMPMPISSSCDQDDGSIIDVLVVYTPAARDSVGGTPAIEGLVHAAFVAANTAYANSQINTTVRQVHVAETDYVETSNVNTDLHRLRATSDGYMDEVHSLREQYGADLVALIREGGNACGVAYLMTDLSTGFASDGFSLTRRSCAVGNLTFAHEMGHNMGCHHDRNNAGNALFQYSYGYHWTTLGGSLRRSVMAYEPGIRVPHFSNPNVLNGGVPTGVAQPSSQSTDNAQSLNNAASTVANFRQSICPAPVNNTCASPLVFQEGEHIFTTFEATLSGPVEAGACAMGSDVWFGHIAQCDGDLTISLCGSSFDTVLAVYPFECPHSPGSFVACNNGFCGQQSQVTIPVTSGQAVRIRVGGVGDSQGEGILNISCQPYAAPCPGDLTGTAIVDVSDLLQLLAAWGPCADCNEDLTDDDIVDVSDLLELLADWGPCT